KVLDVMTRGVVSVHLADSVKDVAKTLIENKIHAVAVMDNNGDVVGVISEMDLLKVINQDLDLTRAEDIMSSYLRSITPDSRIREAAEIMLGLKVHRLIILHPEGRRAVGVLAISDIIREMTKQD
ncbi:CBS domain-containing protein, partial [Candidatus Desantisbacteria bacterium]|nr:CBS domain-containing protein [Candidatus Desantisbacteria bacterium]